MVTEPEGRARASPLQRVSTAATTASKALPSRDAARSRSGRPSSICPAARSRRASFATTAARATACASVAADGSAMVRRPMRPRLRRMNARPPRQYTDPAPFDARPVGSSTERVLASRGARRPSVSFPGRRFFSSTGHSSTANVASGVIARGRPTLSFFSRRRCDPTPSLCQRGRRRRRARYLAHMLTAARRDRARPHAGPRRRSRRFAPPILREG
jgi:hypothetical protein